MNAQGHPARRAGSGEDTGAEADPQQQPKTLDECRRCGLWQRATQGVPGAGPLHARIMMVGEQPGDSEDREGQPFVGPAGRLLDNALREAGVARNEVFITNAVKHFKWEPRGKRRMHKTPGQREIDACHYWLEQELSDVGPQVVVALGSTALKALLEDTHARLQSYFDKVTTHGGRAVLATWHPSYALRAPDPQARERAYADIVAALAQAKQLLHAGRRNDQR
ncbi:MAG TPA: UdgX family uracil-DNA binding protein [Trinickia sp.]|jgi:uracil-DNA glycosylase family protein|uniref:UdgX family uracil-DNA binding protein n=1 Tax=Trinickia sp. TaxID=2571163 RepID=UPI002B77C021|nr:UdgX family uracil-DNA binding protein [Trinickia sp.]HTI16430.1 UdgX family uracil-DNA binding protein [Trinickia sp.]